jgi:hypothetical protein
VPKLRALPAGSGSAGQTGELLCCTYTADGTFVLTGGWDGHLRLWDAAQGTHVTAFRISDKQVTACAASPDGKNLASGTSDGMLGLWDANTHLPKFNFLAHTRPISDISYAPDGKTLATASWDNAVHIWLSLRGHDFRALAGHRDIVAGCRFTPDGQRLLSWSHDATVCVWDVVSGQPAMQLGGHTDRVLAGSVSPDGQWAATGGRDGVLKLWHLGSGATSATTTLRGSVIGCLFLLDGQHLVAVDSNGRLTLHAVPSLQAQGDLIGRTAVEQAALAPSGSQIALAGKDGRVHLVAVDGFDQAPLLVGATRGTRRVATRWQRLFGRSQLVYVFECACPVCRRTFEAPDGKAGQQLECPGCQRALQLTGTVRTLPEK